MVLLELGQKLTAAVAKLHAAPQCNEETLDLVIGEICRALLVADVDVRSVSMLKKEVKASFLQDASGDKARTVKRAVAQSLIKMLSSSKERFRPAKAGNNVIMMVGLQGSGKTTTCSKLAYYYQSKGFRPALICADTFRAGAFDQLKQNCAKIRVPFFGDPTERDPATIAAEGIQVLKQEGYDLIIVDTSGRHRQEAALFEEMREIHEAVHPDETIFVLDSHIGQSCRDQAKTFRETVPVGSIVLTKLDGHAKGGGALTAVSATGAPIAFIGTGEHVGDLEEFDARRFVKSLLGLGDLEGLFQQINESIQPDMAESLIKGRMTFRMWRSQLKMMVQFGGLSGIMSKIPGLAQSGLVGKDVSNAAMVGVKAFMVIMDSMSAKELDNLVPLTDVRVRRIARGSGHQVEEVNLMVEQYSMMSKMVGTMSQLMGGDKNNMKKMAKKNPQMMATMQQMQKGGLSNEAGMAQLARSMGAPGGGMPGMAEMMERVGGGRGGGNPGGLLEGLLGSLSQGLSGLDDFMPPDAGEPGRQTDGSAGRGRRGGRRGKGR